MTGWNLPPGCNVGDIPGNRPEDVAYDAFAERLSERPELQGIGDEKFMSLCAWLWELVGERYNTGYSHGLSDGMARDEDEEQGL